MLKICNGSWRRYFTLRFQEAIGDLTYFSIVLCCAGRYSCLALAIFVRKFSEVHLRQDS